MCILITGHRGYYEKYSEDGLLLEDFEGAPYQRLAYLQSLMARGAIDSNLVWIVPTARADTSAQSTEIVRCTPSGKRHQSSRGLLRECDML